MEYFHALQPAFTKERGPEKQAEKLRLSITINTVSHKPPQNLSFRSRHWRHGLVLGRVTGHLHCHHYGIPLVLQPACDPSLPPEEPKDRSA